MKILSPKTHGYLDYALVGLFALAPSLFGFVGIAATLCYVLAAVHAGMSLITAYPLSIAKIIPFPIHGAMELLVAPFLVASPWLFGFSAFEAPRNFFLFTGALVGVVWMVTNYRAASVANGRTVTGYQRPSAVLYG